MAPRYQDIMVNQVPEFTLENGVEIRLLAGRLNGHEGPVQDIVTNPEYLDVTIPPDTQFEHKIPKDYTAFTYCFEGEGYFDPSREQLVSTETLVIYENGDSVQITTKEQPVRFLLISGKPIKEPIVWYGPIVMNTQAEIQTAFAEYRNGTFLKSH
jgi:redox-sensitive bicupin YhaK (pirin superfamily)